MPTTLRLVDGPAEIPFAVNGTGGDTPYLCKSYDLGFPDPRVVAVETAGNSGMSDLTTLHNARTVAITASVLDSLAATRHQSLEALRALCHPARRPYLYAQCDGWDQERRIGLRASSMSCVVGQKNSHFLEVSLQFTAPTGLFELADLVASSPVYPLTGSPGLALSPGGTTAGGGPTDPVATPALFLTPGGTTAGGYTDDVALALSPGTGSNVVTVNNAGSAPAPPVYVINGPCGDPRIYNRTDRVTFAFANLTILPGHFVLVDVAARTAYMDGNPGQSVYPRINWSASRWFSLGPGDTDLEFTTGSSDTGCSLVVQHSPKWL